MNFKRYHASKNLFDVSTTIEGTFVRAGNTSESNPLGSETLNNSWNCSDYIAVLPNTTYTVHYPNYTESISAGLVYFSDMSVSGAISGVPTTTQEADTFTFTTPNNCNYIRFSWQNLQGNSVMLNTGSEPLPYEPYGDTWHDIPHYIHNTSTDTITTLPADIYANDTTATVGLKGDMSQTGTPSPTTPIQPSECGERTGNLFDRAILQNNKGINTSGVVTDTTGRIATVTPIDVSQYTAVTLSYTSNSCSFIFATFNDGTLVDRQASKTSGYTIDVTNCDKLFICFYRASDISTNDVTEIMLNTGSTPQPYEPYGYKIPILSNSTTTPVYLGEVQTTRKIKKLVLDGTENVEARTSSVTGYTVMRLTVTGYLRNTNYTPISTHYLGQQAIIGIQEITENNRFAFLVSSSGIDYMYIYDNRYTTADDFKAYLAQQYSAGTPVCIWYVLATPETAVVNEPLRKIGDYADTVSSITIPTIAGANTLSVDTTLQPSEVTVNYRGWHPVSAVHERINGAWD